MYKDLEKELLSLKNSEKSKFLARFFKTGKGEYAEGDIFLGISVPKQREIAKKYLNLSFSDLEKLLNSKIHELRLTALIILVAQYKKADNSGKEKIVKFYLKNTKNINNWDLVDISAYILGNYLINKNTGILNKLAKSKNIWERRISIVATFEFIRNKKLDKTIEISEILLSDKHDLIHKAVGWMLRELGKRDLEEEIMFLNKNYKVMPRTMLRYSVERFPEEKRKMYLGKS